MDLASHHAAWEFLCGVGRGRRGKWRADVGRPPTSFSLVGRNCQHKNRWYKSSTYQYQLQRCPSNQSIQSVVVPHQTSSSPKGPTSSAMQELVPKSSGQLSCMVMMIGGIIPPIDPTTGLFLVEKHIKVLLDSILFVVSLHSCDGPIRILHASPDVFPDRKCGGGVGGFASTHNLDIVHYPLPGVTLDPKSGSMSACSVLRAWWVT